MQSIIVAINNGWPTSKRQSSHDLAPLYDKRSELVVDNGLVFWRTLSSPHINEKRNTDADSPISYLAYKDVFGEPVRYYIGHS
jgi:hypothetical protein